MKKVIKIFFAIVILLLAIPYKSIKADSLTDYLNNVVGPNEQYSTKVSPAYLKNNSEEEYINPQNGELTLVQNDYSLPGVNGLNLNIARIYKSGISNVHDMKAMYNSANGTWVDYIESDVKTASFYENRYNLGIGERFSFPTIEVKQNEDNTDVKFLHTESGDVYRLIGAANNTYTLENHPVKDVEVKEDNSYNNGQSDGKSKYVMTEKDGKSTYFSEDGRILQIRDRYGNSIKFEYGTYNYTIDGYTRSRRLINKITDTIGRIVTIDYTEDPSLTLSKNSDGTYSGDLQGKFQVIIHLPDGKKIVYDKSSVLYSSASFHSIRERMQRVYGIDNNIKYHYWYEQPDLGFTYMGGENRQVKNRYENLNQINYLSSNKLKRYSYGSYVKNLGSNGTMEYRKVIGVQDSEKTGYDTSKTNFLDQILVNIKKQVSYTYLGEPDGHGTSGYNSTDNNYLKNTYSYSTTKTDLSKVSTTYKYNGLQDLTSVESSGNNHRETTETTYDNNKLPIIKKKQIFNFIGEYETDLSITEYENYVYDNCGNLTSYAGPIANRDSNGNLKDNENTVMYTYGPFGIVKSKAWKQDSAIASRIDYDIATNGNINTETKLHMENGINNSIVTNFQYDSKGNLIKKILDNKYVTNYEYGVDGDGVDQKGALLTKEYSIVDGQEIYKKYAYDYSTGLLKASIDPSGRKSMEYDALYRVSKVTFPDNSIEAYQYLDNAIGDREVRYIDPNNHTFSYTYDIFGNISTYSIDYITNKKIMYDANSNKTKEIDANGNSTRYEYNSLNQVTQKSFWENDTAQKKSMSIQYNYAYSPDIPLQIIQTDEEGYITKLYYDKLNRLIKKEVTPDKVNFYTTNYAYDYKNNELSEKDDIGTIITKAYDDLGRLVSKKDACNNETTYRYNADNSISKETNANGFSTDYEYDSCGRMIRKFQLSTDSTISVTRYIYDVSGNKIKEITPNNYALGLDNQANIMSMPGTSYVYDCMKRVIATVSPEGNTIEYKKYDGNGNVKKEVDGLRYDGKSIDSSPGRTYEYDAAGKVIKDTDANGISSYNGYDAVGNLIYSINKNGVKTTYEYNYDRTLKRINYNDGETHVDYTYNRLGQKLTETDQRGNTTTYSYNGLGKLKAIYDPYYSSSTPNLNSITYTYDGRGNLIDTIDKKGNITYLSYYDNNLLKEKRIPLELNLNNNIIYSIESYEYDPIGNITSKTLTGTKDSSDKRITNYSYYKNGLLQTVSTNAGESSKNYYDKNGNIIKTESLRDNQSYNITKAEYDISNRPVKNITLVDEASIYNASAIPNISNLRDSEYNGKLQLITGYNYDMLGNITQVINPMAYMYLESDADNRSKYIIFKSYDNLNRLNKESWRYYTGYTPNYSNSGIDLSGNYGNIIKHMEDKLTFNSQYELVYNQYGYDNNGNIVYKEKADGTYTDYSYDKLDRLKAVKDRDKSYYSAAYEYDAAGNKTKVTNAMGNAIAYTYDKLNRLETTTDPSQTVIEKNIYDENGNIIKKIDAKGYLSGNDDNSRYGTLYKYDLANRLTKIIDPEISVLNDNTKFTESYEYNQFGEKAKEIDALGEATQYSYNNSGKLVKVTDALGVSTQYSYDSAGNKINMTDGRNYNTYYNYGTGNLMLSTSDPNSKNTNYKYDLALNMVDKLDRNLNETIYTYDSRKLLLSREVLQTKDKVSYLYDSLENRIKMTDSTGATDYTYDNNNWLTKISKNNVSQLCYTYDELGNILTIMDSKGYVTTNEYDNCSRLKNVKYSLGTVTKITTYNYDKNGNREAIIYDGGVTESYSYDKNNKLKAVQNKDPNGKLISSYSYQYDLAGREISKADSYGTTNYTYDGDGRVKSVQAPGKLTVYSYDNAGNRVSLAETYTSPQTSDYKDSTTGNPVKYSLKTSNYIYSGTNSLLRLQEVMSNGEEVLQKLVNYSYDDNGNETSNNTNYIYSTTSTKAALGISIIDDTSTEIDKSIELTNKEYDGFNRLKRVEIIKSGTRTIIEYAYNGDDLRLSKTIKKSTNGYAPEITNYLYDRQHVIMETDENNNLKVRYIRGVNYIARIDNQNKLSYYLYNGHGDVVQTVSPAGSVENQYDYDIFGETTLSIENYSDAIKYGGEYYDSETGLYYLRARYYNPYTGRFISEDSYLGEDSNPLSLNLYTFCSNDPIIFIDPSGHVQVELNEDGTEQRIFVKTSPGYD
ncbi:RHS repeat protein, partial [Clostridium sp. 19966]|uniref:RHS repeat-associated core domain-containing protein n=1 Tax=Clostridium sp. 19966 TaxID=2768166 RepID=UPI0028DF5CE6